MQEFIAPPNKAFNSTQYTFQYLHVKTVFLCWQTTEQLDQQQRNDSINKSTEVEYWPCVSEVSLTIPLKPPFNSFQIMFLPLQLSHYVFSPDNQYPYVSVQFKGKLNWDRGGEEHGLCSPRK